MICGKKIKDLYHCIGSKSTILGHLIEDTLFKSTQVMLKYNYQIYTIKGVPMKNMIQKITQFRDERGWKEYHNPKDLAISISLEANELLENFQWRSSEEALLNQCRTLKKRWRMYLFICCS